MSTYYHFEDFKHLGNDGLYDVFQVTEVETKRRWFRKDVVVKKKLLLASIPSYEKLDNIRKKYKTISYFGTACFLNDKYKYDKNLRQFIYKGILYNKLGI